MADAPSGIEAPQEDELEIMSAFPHLPRKCWEFAKLCDQLLGVLEREVLGRDLPKDTPFQRLMRFVLAKARDDARSAVRLAKAGYGRQAAALSRSLVEAAINARYIEKEPEERSLAFVGFSEKYTKLLGKKIESEIGLQGLSEHDRQVLEQVKEIEAGTGWPRSLKDRAYDIGTDEWKHAYDIDYFLLSGFAHQDVSAQVRRSVPSQEVRIGTGRGPEMVDFALGAVFDYLREVATVAYKAFGFSEESLEKLRESAERVSRANE
jgi:hypothetical protein